MCKTPNTSPAFLTAPQGYRQIHKHATFFFP
uniref:Uncharacterized protein n=1 Tax=Anguilla anguilla TaxID=7936 RepID=A0A0E9V2X8_ANGAN